MPVRATHMLISFAILVSVGPLSIYHQRKYYKYYFFLKTKTYYTNTIKVLKITISYTYKSFQVVQVQIQPSANQSHVEFSVQDISAHSGSGPSHEPQTFDHVRKKQ